MNENKENIPKIRFPGFTSAWEQRKLGEISKLSSSKRVHREDYIENGVPFFRGSEISKLGNFSKLDEILYISEEYYRSIKNKYGVPQIGDILITAVGTLGNPYLISNNKPFYFKDGNLIWLSNIKIDSQYLNIYLSDGIGKERVLGSAIGSNQKALTMAKLQNVEILFPHKEEQVKISTFFNQINNLITLHQRKLNNVQSLKVGLLQKMFPKNDENFPEVRFPGFTNPWEQRKLGNIVNIRSGRDYKHLSEGEIPVYGTGGYMLSVNEALSYKEDAIGIGRKGTIDKPYILRAPFWTVDTLFYAVPETNNDLDFIYDIFQNINWKQKDESTGVPSLSKTAINDIDVLVPDYKEQKIVGSFFEKLDNLITLHQRKLEHLQEQKKALLQQMFV